MDTLAALQRRARDVQHSVAAALALPTAEALLRAALRESTAAEAYGTRRGARRAARRVRAVRRACAWVLRRIPTPMRACVRYDARLRALSCTHGIQHHILGVTDAGVAFRLVGISTTEIL